MSIIVNRCTGAMVQCAMRLPMPHERTSVCLYLVLRRGDRPCEKRHSFFEFSLCLSRACPGKMLVLYINGSKSGVFRTKVVPVRLPHPSKPRDMI
jgi:hypothetical protein